MRPLLLFWWGVPGPVRPDFVVQRADIRPFQTGSKEFWEQLSIVGALIVFVGTQFSASSVTALIEGFINPSMNGEAGTKSALKKFVIRA